MFGFDSFLLALTAVVVVSVAAPELGASGGLLHLEWVARYGIALVFFLYGLTLAADKLKAGALHWRLHLTVQGLCFLGFPLVVLLAGLPFKSLMPPALWLGFLFLAALPGTISSAVAMTSLARGNVSAAVFNATISGIIAIVATPLLMSLMAGVAGVSLPLGEVIGKVVLLIALPMVAGQALRRWLSPATLSQAVRLKPLDRVVILAIVANAISDSMIEGLWTQQKPAMLAAITAASLLLFGVMHSLTSLVCRWLDFTREDRVATLLSATQKSLAIGVPLAPVIFAGRDDLGIIIAPIMIYHMAQLIIVGVLAGRWSRQALQEQDAGSRA